MTGMTTGTNKPTDLRRLTFPFFDLKVRSVAVYLVPNDEYTNYMLTEIWIRPTITYGLVACFVTEVEKK